VISFRFQRVTLVDDTGAVGCLILEETLSVKCDTLVSLSNFTVLDKLIRIRKQSKIGR